MAKEVDTKGYIKLYRKSQKTEVFKNPYAWQLFTYCLFNAKFTGSDKEVGTFITTQDTIKNDLGWSRPSVIKFMKFLKETKCIDYTTSNKNTIIKIINFKKYQGTLM